MAIELRLEDAEGKGQDITINLTPVEQRRIAEAGFKSPAFRMWITEREYYAIRRTAPDYTYCQLADGRWTVWRSQVALDAMHAASDAATRQLAAHIESRIIHDDTIV